jgi:hemerythrin superfamily protein
LQKITNKERLREEHKSAASNIGSIMQDLQNDELDLDIFNKFETDLKDHMYEEETYIFPELVDQFHLVNEVNGFETEHAAMWRILDHINEEIISQHFIKIKKYFDELSSILSDHDRREEEFIYSKMNDNVSYQKIVRPKNWKCSRLRK